MPELNDTFLNKPASEDRNVIGHNLKVFDTSMLRLLSEESFGGNADVVEIDGKGYPCAAANGYANRETGEIVAFGNIQNISPDVVRNNQHFTLRVAVNLSASGQSLSAIFFNIIEFKGLEGFSEIARNRITQTIKEYNRAHAKA